MRLTLSERRRIVANMIRKPSGRAQLAEAMKEPLRNYRDYEAVGRRAFMVDPLEPGQLAYYDKDVDVPAWVVSEDGQDVLCIVKGTRVSVGLFEIATNPMIPITQIFQRKFDLEARVKAKTKAEIFRKEDTKIFSMLLAMVQAGTHPNPVIPVDVSATPVTIDHFSEAMSLIESHGNIRCANIFMNPGNMKILRALGKDYFEPAITNELLRTGFVGTIMGCQIHTTRFLALLGSCSLVNRSSSV